jgi:hypothetical protein
LRRLKLLLCGLSLLLSRLGLVLRCLGLRLGLLRLSRSSFQQDAIALFLPTCNFLSCSRFLHTRLPRLGVTLSQIRQVRDLHLRLVLRLGVSRQAQIVTRRLQIMRGGLLRQRVGGKGLDARASLVELFVTLRLRRAGGEQSRDRYQNDGVSHGFCSLR